MYLHGAHVTSWQPAGEMEVLWVSRHSEWHNGGAIRGGVPICFPWFGPRVHHPTAPLHGFVRTRAWQLESIAQSVNGVTVSMFTESDQETKKWWPADFRLTHRVTFGPELTLELILMNTGSTSCQFEEALHTYFSVGDVKSAAVQGLERVQYIDRISKRRETQEGEITIVSETDRLYLDAASVIELKDPRLSRRIRISKENSLATVVWNPWVRKAQAMPDFGDEEWAQMICIEPGNVGDFAIDLAPGRAHSMKSKIAVVRS